MPLRNYNREILEKRESCHFSTLPHRKNLEISWSISRRSHFTGINRGISCSSSNNCLSTTSDQFVHTVTLINYSRD